MIEKNNSAYKPAVYARLSDEDSRAGISLSIENQLDILRKYCKDKGFQAPKEFFDDDKTGTDFNRAGWQALYADAVAKNIDCIIIKDTSTEPVSPTASGEIGFKAAFILKISAS